MADRVAGHMLNGQTLLEFPHPHTSEGEGVVLKVKSATLWVKVKAVDLESYGRVQDRNMTLWIFRVAPSQLRNATYLSGKVTNILIQIHNNLQERSIDKQRQS